MSDLTSALEAALAAENAAVYGYSLIGAQLAAHDKASARAGYDAHRAQVLVVGQWVQAAGASPSPAAPLYDLPSPVVDPAAAHAALAAIEESTAAAYADIVALADADLRRSAALALQFAAVREAQWRGGSVPFPGLVGRFG
jgi:Domain of unknown function (DUF4439)